MRNLFVAFLLLTLVPPTGLANPAIDQIEIAPNLFWFRPDTPIGNQSSLVFISQGGALLVDANIDTVAPYLEKFLSDQAPGRPWYAIISHHHGDHAQGLEVFDNSIVAIVPTRQRQRLQSTSLTSPDSPPLRSNVLPAITFNDKLTLHFNDETVEIIQPPIKSSHTDGDAFVYFVERGVLYVGDHYIADRLPLIDFGGGGSIDGYLRNLQWIIDSFPLRTKVIPGHGLFAPYEPRVDSRVQFAEWARQIISAVAVIDRNIMLGDTEDEVVTKGLPRALAGLGEKPRYISEERWIRVIYQQRILEKKKDY